MQAARSATTYGPSHRDYEQTQAGRYRPEAPQAVHDITTQLGQLVELEEKWNRDTRYEDKLEDLQRLMIGYYALMRGHTPRPKEADRLEKDLAKVFGIIEKIGVDGTPPPVYPHVTAQTGSSDPNSHTVNLWWDKPDRKLTVLREHYEFTYREMAAAERENHFRAIYNKSLPNWAIIRGLASQWGLYGPRTRIRHTESANSLDHVRETILQRLETLKAERAESSQDGAQ